MCEAVSMGIMAAATVASGLASMKASSDKAGFDSAIARRNAQQARDAEALSLQEGERDAAVVARKAGRVGAAQIMAGVASGMRLDSPTLLDLGAASSRTAALDEESARYRAKLRALGFRTQADDYDAQASMAESAGAFGQVQGFLSMAPAAFYGYKAGKAAGYWGKG